jgi:microcystin-dependent protein
MGTPTTNFGWTLPTVQGDPDAWGGFLNGNLTSQDTFLRSFMNTFKSNNPPAFATLQAGTFWINDTTNPWVYAVYDGTNWVTVGTIDSTNHIFIPVNSAGNSFNIGDYKYSSIAANHGQWLLCDGATISRTTYSALNTLFFGLTPSYPFGNGDGSTTFTLPDMRGRVGGAIGAGVGLTVRTIGSSIGEENHNLTSAELPNPITSRAGLASFTFGQGTTAPGISSTSAGGSGVVSNDGLPATSPHNNMQPTAFAGNYFIFVGV